MLLKFFIWQKNKDIKLLHIKTAEADCFYEN